MDQDKCRFTEADSIPVPIVVNPLGGCNLAFTRLAVAFALLLRTSTVSSPRQAAVQLELISTWNMMVTFIWYQMQC